MVKTRVFKTGGKPEPLQVYVRKLAGQLAGEKNGISLSAAALRGVSAMGKEFMRRNAERSHEMALHTGKKTIGTKHVRAAVRLHTFGSLGEHAQSEASRAVGNFKAAHGNTKH